MKKITYTILTAIMASAVTGCDKREDFDATGIFEATTVTVSAETAGKIINMSIEEGDSVRLGQMLAEIDTTMLLLQQKQLGSQRRSVESSTPDIAAQAESLRSQINHQREELARQGRLLADGATTQKRYDDTKAQLAVLEGQLAALMSTLGKNRTSISDNAGAIQYQWEQIREQIAKSRIVAPLTGTVLVKYMEPGEYATPGRAICRIADLDNIYLRAYFTAGQLADLRIGQKVTVTADFGGDRQYEYPGVITWIAQESEFTPKTIQTKDSRENLVYAVKVAVRNDGRLKLGQYGEVRL